MLGEAILIAKGIQPEGHILSIQELLKTKTNTSRPINAVEHLRTLRHNINYNGYSPTLEETKDAISIAKNCFEPLYKTVLKGVS